MEPAEVFGGVLKELRTRARLTQKDLAEKAGVAQRTVSSLEQALYEPVWSTAVALAQALGVDIRAFLKGPSSRPVAERGRPRKEDDPPAKPKRSATKGGVR